MNDYIKNLKLICDIFAELLNKTDRRIILYCNANKLIEFVVDITDNNKDTISNLKADKSIFERLFGKQ